MGVEPFLITASVNLVLAQRFARKICTDCKQPMKNEKKILEDCGFTPEQIANAKLVKGGGCRTCNGSGYKGRVALYEVMRFADNLKEMVLQGASTAELKTARDQGRHEHPARERHQEDHRRRDHPRRGHARDDGGLSTVGVTT